MYAIRSYYGPFVVGFAPATEQIAEHAQDKLKRKGLDMIAANDVSRPEQGFNNNHNVITSYSIHYTKLYDDFDLGQLRHQ